MMWKKTLFALSIFLAFFVVSCAPQDESAARHSWSTSDADDDDNREEINKPLVEVPKQLKDRIDATLKHVRSRELLKEHSFWTIFHGILGMGPDFAYLFDTKTGERVKAIDYICKGGHVRGLEFVRTPDGLDVVTMPGSGVGQGHQDQFIAEMTQWGLPKDKQFSVGGETYTFADFVNHSKARTSVKGKQELSWAIIIIGQFFGTDIRWTNNRGEKVAFEDVVNYELHEPIADSPVCGGTHRLFGLSWAYHLHMAKGGKKVRVWQEVANTTAHYKELARRFQNRDGSFSTNYFRGKGWSQDIQLRIASTGHILEWLALALSDKELREPWVQDAVSALAVMVLENSSRDLDGGGLYHAAHGLAIYRTRVFGPEGIHAPLIPLPPKE